MARRPSRFRPRWRASSSPRRMDSKSSAAVRPGCYRARRCRACSCGKFSPDSPSDKNEGPAGGNRRFCRFPKSNPTRLAARGRDFVHIARPNRDPRRIAQADQDIPVVSASLADTNVDLAVIGRSRFAKTRLISNDLRSRASAAMVFVLLTGRTPRFPARVGGARGNRTICSCEQFVT